METAWAAVIGAIPGAKWVDMIQLATGIYVRFLCNTGVYYQWSPGGGTWTSVSNIATFLAAGTLASCGGVTRV